jgi:hypothetical protein
LTDGTVNQPATRRQLRILWRQVTRSFLGRDHERFEQASGVAVATHPLLRASAD